jgi:cohesin complex subunit SCC1
MTVDRNAITLTGDAMDLNLVLPDVNWDFDFDDEHAPSTSTRTRAGQHVARRADITLATDDFDVALSDGFDINLGSADGIGSYDFSLDLNLGLDGDGLDFDDSMELEVGRDAAMSRGGPRHSIVSSRRAGRESMELPGSDLDFDMLSRGSRSRDPSEQPFGADMNIGGLGDLGLGMDEDIDLGISFDDPVGVPELELGGDGQRTPTMGASPLTTPPRTPPPDFPLSEPDIVLPGDNDVDAEGEVDGEEGDGTTPKKAKRARKEKKQIVDAVIELANGPGPRTGRGRGRGANANGGYAAPAVPPEILATPSYVPSNPAVARLLEIRADPLAHFMPTIPAGKGQNQTQDAMVCAAPPGMDLAPELTALFMRPVRGSAAHGVNKRKGEAAKQVVDTDGEGKSEGEVEEPEVGRRQSSIAPSLRTLDRNSLGPLDVGFNDSANLDSFQIDIPQDQDMDVGMEGIELPPVDDAGLDLGGRERSQSAHPSDRARSRSRLSTPGMAYEDEGMSFADAACPIAAFDIRSQTSGSQASQSQAQAGQGDLPDVREDGKGYSKNTIKAINLIRAELGPSEEAKEDEEKVMSFKKMSEKVRYIYVFCFHPSLNRVD